MAATRRVPLAAVGGRPIAVFRHALCQALASGAPRNIEEFAAAFLRGIAVVADLQTGFEGWRVFAHHSLVGPDPSGAFGNSKGIRACQKLRIG